MATHRTVGRKVILSRKGFDSANGGVPSPVLPDGTLLSLPIPDDRSPVTYGDLTFDGTSLGATVSQLTRGKVAGNRSCHVDPDIRPGLRRVPGWRPAFGQKGGAQTELARAQVAPGDLFLFFGWFRRAEWEEEGNLRFVRHRLESDFWDYSDLHVVYGYLEVGEVVTDPQRIAEYPWHPHGREPLLSATNNALYLPTERLSFDEALPGCGTLDWREDRVLTQEDCPRSRWVYRPFLHPDHCARKGTYDEASQTVTYAGAMGQEFVFYDSPGLLEWAQGLIRP